MLIIAQRCQLWFKQKEWWSDGIRLVDLLTILRPCMFWFWPETTSPHIKPTASGSCHFFLNAFTVHKTITRSLPTLLCFPPLSPASHWSVRSPGLSSLLDNQVLWARLLIGQSGPLDIVMDALWKTLSV